MSATGTSASNLLALSAGHVVDKYRIESVLGYGGFGIVYKAVHVALGRQVAIKEYLPQEIATREGSTVRPLSERESGDYEYGKARFLDEAKQLAGFSHSNIVGCSDFIEANGTAYLVMDFEDGLPLDKLLRSRREQNNSLSEDEIKRVVLPLLDGLAAIHEHGVLHRDIKPSNIFIRRRTEQPVLIDFGSAKQGFSERSKSMAPYTEGYAAMEQIEEAGNLGPWTDIYAIGAVMWRIIADENPPKVESRSFAAVRGRPDPLRPATEVGKERHSAAFLQVVDKCLAVREDRRYQSAQELQQALRHPTLSEAGAGAEAHSEADAERESAPGKSPAGYAQQQAQHTQQRAWQKAKTHLDALWQHGKSLARSLGGFFGAVFEMLVDFINTWGETKIRPTVPEEQRAKIKTHLASAGMHIKPLGRAFMDLTAALFEILGDGISRAISGVYEGIRKAADFINAGVNACVRMLKNSITATAQARARTAAAIRKLDGGGGRASRAEYWGWLILGCLYWGPGPFALYFVQLGNAEDRLMAVLSGPLLPVYLYLRSSRIIEDEPLVFIATLLVFSANLWLMLFTPFAIFSAAIRRLHDVGHNGLWLFAPPACIALALWNPAADLALIGLFVSTVLILYWTMKKGDAGDNPYGPDPLLS